MRWVVLAAALLVYLSPSLAVPTYRAHASSADASSNSVYQWGAESHSQPWKVHGLVATVSLGASESRFAVEADGSVWAWGRNKSGQLGQGSLKSSRWPKRIPYLGRVIQVAAGPDHTLALLRDGRVMSWGDNSTGQLGDGTFRDRLRPVRVLGLRNVVSVAAPSDGWIAPFHRSGIRDGVRIRRYAESLGGYSLALKRDGTVWMWGSNYFLMNGVIANSPGGAINRPRRVPRLKNIVSISAGAAHAAALTRSGRVIVWGDNTFEQLGQPQAYVDDRHSDHEGSQSLRRWR